MSLGTSECIPINSNGREYTDCMEFSLLRFLHLLLYDVKQLKMKGNSTCNSENEYVKKHLIKYPIIYQDVGKHTRKEREDWSINVSDRDFFEYYRNDKAELFTSVRNILNFIKNYLDIEVNYNNPQETLNKVSEKFSTEDKKINIFINNINEEEGRIEMNEIMMYLSRPDNEYHLFSHELIKYTERKTLIIIKINDYKYNWHLTEILLNKYDFRIKNKFITGHSVISNY